MKIIEFEKWTPSAEDPRKREYTGQRTAEEVFQELKHRLESLGYLPDEYLLLDSHWENGREIPQRCLGILYRRLWRQRGRLPGCISLSRRRGSPPTL